ncbi:MAG: Glu-tRNA(Gln) amidotransferase subunit GatE [Candidatus Aenigmarchaeota archaeon]|nr:Glu-tRNA(Gln) amidotransferase subunit GatE [Candidatus Aenigmarchaeota archaeon]
MDYGKLGLRCGIEIHQQLDTAHKLFCGCPPMLSSDKPVSAVRRRMRAVAGELGEVDAAAMHELIIGKEFNYQVYEDSSCLVETDSEPPHSLDSESLRTALTIAVMLGCEIPNEAHVMRKTVIDGSNTSGFQRTLIIGLDGRLPTGFGPVGITNVCLEEDAAQILQRDAGAVTYGLDRLAIPLVEIGTSADIGTPEQAREVASGLGTMLRSTGKVKRGIGTIRQDINISIREGARVEIKGAQELRLVPKLVENEALRQLSLAGIRDELRKKGFRKVRSAVKDVSSAFRKTDSRIMKGKRTFAIVIPGFAGFLARKLTETRTLGNEIASYVKARAGIPGIIHSDEDLQKYRLEREFEDLRGRLDVKHGDTLIIMAAERPLAEKTARALEERVNQLPLGVPREVRRALPNGDTEFLRPLPGAARMYPETDVEPIQIVPAMLKEVRKNLPETWEKKITRLARSYPISKELSGQMVHSGMDVMFERLAGRHDPRLVSSTLLSAMKGIEREGLDTGAITEKNLDELFGLVEGKKMAKEAIPDVLRALAKSPGRSTTDIVSKLGVGGMTSAELVGIIRKILTEKKGLLSHPRRENVLMGLVMREVRGKIDGKAVLQALRSELKRSG